MSTIVLELNASSRGRMLKYSKEKKKKAEAMLYHSIIEYTEMQLDMD